MPRSFGFFCPITPFWKIRQATSVTINNPMNFPATPAWSLGLCPAQSSLYTCTSAHVCISLCFPAAPAFPPKDSIHKEFVRSLFLSDFIPSSLAFHSPSSVPHPAHHPELTYRMLTCGQLASPAFVQISNKYLCTFSCNASYPWESLPHRSADVAQGSFPAPLMKLFAPCQNITVWPCDCHSWWITLHLGCAPPPSGVSPRGPRPEFSVSFLCESGESFCSATP